MVKRKRRPYGYFGQDCTERCKDTCEGCNYVNGLCESGCQPGWTGNNCAEGMILHTICKFAICIINVI